jgi:hypothetical protein
VNPVASPHFNFTVTEPMGIVGVLAPEEAPLLALVSLIAPAITSGNTVVALASTAQPYPAIVLGEMLATSDLPGGVVNLLTGYRKEMVPTFATHTHFRAVAGVASAEERKAIKLAAADSVKRVRLTKAEEPVDWFSDKAQSLYELRDLLEYKTTWHPPAGVVGALGELPGRGDRHLFPAGGGQAPAADLAGESVAGTDRRRATVHQHRDPVAGAPAQRGPEPGLRALYHRRRPGGGLRHPRDVSRWTLS